MNRPALALALLALTPLAVHAARLLGRELGPDGLLVLNVSGRGDKDVDTVRKALAAGTVVPKAQEARRAAAARAAARPAARPRKAARAKAAPARKAKPPARAARKARRSP